MVLTVTRPIEQAIMEVPGIRRVRSRTFRGAAEISAQFDPATNMVVALQQVQNRVGEVRGDMPPDLDLRRSADAGGVSLSSASNLTGGLSSADLHDYGFYVMRPALSRVAGVGRVEVLVERHARDRSHRRSGRLVAAGLTVDDVAGALKGANVLVPAGRFPEGGLQHLVLASGLWESVERHREHAGGRQGRRDGARARSRRTSCHGAPDRTSLIVGKGGRGDDRGVAAARRQHPHGAAGRRGRAGRS